MERIGYGALYLDRGERMSKVREQLRDVNGVVSWFFDVIGGPGDEALVAEYVVLVERHFERHAPGIPAGVIGSIAPDRDNDGPRPARMAMLEAFAEGRRRREVNGHEN